MGDERPVDVRSRTFDLGGIGMNTFDGILERNDLSDPDGRPIYKYEIRDDEFHRLEEELIQRSKRSLRSWSNADAAALCMYVATWWQRRYDGGAWSWSDPLEPVELADTAHRSNYSSIHGAVERGLDYLGIELVTLEGKTQYLGTLAAQGGLPVRLLEGNPTYLRAFKSMFEELETFGTEQIDPKELGRNELHRFPNTFSETPRFGKLLGRFARDVYIHSSVLEGEADDSFDAFQQSLPDFEHSRIPLPLQRSQARQLFKIIVGEARDTRTQASPWYNTFHRLAPVGEKTYRLEVRPEFNEYVEVERLAEAIGLESHGLPLSMSFRLFVEGRDETEGRAWAMANRIQDRGTYQIESLEESFLAEGPSAARAIELKFFEGENHFGTPVVLDDGLSDAPWIAAPPSDSSVPRQIFTTGSARSRRDALLVCVVPEQTLEASFDETIESLGTMERLERDVYRIESECRVRAPDGTSWKIVPSCDEKSHGRLDVLDRRRDLQHSRSRPIFGGEPRVRLLDVPEKARVKWRPDEEKHRYPLPEAPYGDGMLEAVAKEGYDEHVLVQKRMARLPSGASLSFEPMRTERKGRLVFEEFGDIRVGCRRDDVAIEVVERDGSTTRVLVATEQMPPPSEFDVVVRWKNSETQTELTVPFPRSNARFVGQDHTLSDSAEWVVHSQPLVAARAFPPIVQKTPTIEGKLVADDVQYSTIEALRFQESLEPRTHRNAFAGYYELPLGKLQEQVALVLCSTFDLDAHVELTLSWMGSSNEEEQHLKIYRYEGQIAQASERPLAFRAVSNHEPISDPDAMELHAFQFKAPQTHHHRLEHEEERVWTANRRDWTSGTWCIVGIRNGRISHRPCMVDLGESNPDDTWAYVCENDDREERREQFRRLFRTMADEPAHHAWGRLEEVFEVAESLPATTFDALDCLVQEPEATAMGLVQTNEVERWWSELEELPFLWHAIPVDAWESAMEQYLNHFERYVEEETPLEFDELDHDPLTPLVECIEDKLGGRSTLLAYLDTVHDWSIPIDSETRKNFQRLQLQNDIIDQLLQGEYRSLRQRHEHLELHQWPTWDERTNYHDWHPHQTHSLANELDNLPGALKDVVDAPVATAVASHIGAHFTRADIMQLRRIRSFDTRWFDQCYNYTLCKLL